jgi:DHA1 family tetracycline resistance protein-like MFS transporter
MEALKQTHAAIEVAGAPRLVLFLTVFIDLLGFGIVIPFLPMFASTLGVGAVGVGVVLAVYSLMQLLFAPILGAISDRIGRRPVIMIGLAGSALGYLIYGFATSFWILLLSRAIHGSCAATISTAQAYIADTTDGSERARGMGLIGAAFGLGFVLGPAMGGLLGGGGLRIPALFAAGLSVGNLILAALLLPESKPAQLPAASVSDAAPQGAGVLQLMRRLGDRRLARLFVLAFLFTFALAALEATFALMVPRVYGYGAVGIGGLLAFAGLVQALAQGLFLGRLVQWLGEVRLVRVGAIVMGVGMAPLAASSSRPLLFVLLALIAIGYGVGSPSLASLISRGSAQDSQGGVLGLNQSALSLARVFGPIAGGFFYQTCGASAPYYGAAAVMLAALAVGVGIEAVA